MISGQEVVREIENQKTDAASKPFAEVRILSCGELIPKSKGRNEYIFLVILMHTQQADTLNRWHKIHTKVNINMRFLYFEHVFVF